MCVFTDVEHLHWLHTLKDADIAIDAALQWECKAVGNPEPTYKWLKNGQILAAEVRTAQTGCRAISYQIMTRVLAFISVIWCLASKVR